MSDIDQEADQGFISNKLRVQSVLEEHRVIESTHPKDFKPRMINSKVALYLEPKQCLASVVQIRSEFSPYCKQQYSRRKESCDTPGNKYLNHPQHYKLIYSRNSSPFSAEQHFANNNIDISSLLTYNPANYTLLKEQKIQGQTLEIKNSNDQLVFDSRFESGNLLCAFRYLPQRHSYTLLVQNDTNTKGYNQWFYFSVRGIKAGTTYSFQIVNLKKKNSLFRQEMKPIIWSEEEARIKGNGWAYKGNNIRYSSFALFEQENSVTQQKYFCLEFDLIFDKDQSYVSVSAGMPYSYSRLMDFLRRAAIVATKNHVKWQLKSIAHTLADNQVPYLTIGEEPIKIVSHNKVLQRLKIKKGNHNSLPKKIIVILARQHPGETNSSLLMQALLNELAHNSPSVKQLLDQYIFKVFPMVNVDGVIYGNSRCDLSGFDLNRVWKRPNKHLHSPVYNIIKQLKQLSEQYEISCCFDLHGHSKKYNIFGYCCKSNYLQCRQLPFMIAKDNKRFHFEYCTFGISKEKETTARAIIHAIAKQINVITIETSFFGVKTQKEPVRAFQPLDFKEVASSILSATGNYLFNDPSRARCQQELETRREQFLQYDKKNNEEDSGSDSDPEGDEIDMEKKFGKLLPKQILEAKNILNDLKLEKTVVEKMQQSSVGQKPVSHITKLKRQTQRLKHEESDMKTKCQQKDSQKKIVPIFSSVSNKAIITTDMGRKTRKFQTHKLKLSSPNSNEDKTKTKTDDRQMTPLNIKQQSAVFGEPNSPTDQFRQTLQKGQSFNESMKQLYYLLMNKKQVNAHDDKQYQNTQSLHTNESHGNQLHNKVIRVRRRASTYKRMQPKQQFTQKQLEPKEYHYKESDNKGSESRRSDYRGTIYKRPQHKKEYDKAYHPKQSEPVLLQIGSDYNLRKSQNSNNAVLQWQKNQRARNFSSKLRLSNDAPNQNNEKAKDKQKQRLQNLKVMVDIWRNNYHRYGKALQ